ncbi:MAG: hypothetical protein LBP22_03835 [Deltaproteobacteria bacterium]|jgi:hypothetical protein|nr:hypothetical protein [Deltaproteobacteria bacterium]
MDQQNPEYLEKNLLTLVDLDSTLGGYIAEQLSKPEVWAMFKAKLKAEDEDKLKAEWAESLAAARARNEDAFNAVTESIRAFTDSPDSAKNLDGAIQKKY